jgi:uncharacterized protein YdaU (DUF1376 family)
MFTNDWVAGTATLSPEARGVFSTLLCHQWDAGGLPNRQEQLRRLGTGSCLVSRSKWTRIWTELLSKFEQGADGLLRNPKLERVRAQMQRAQSHREAGGRARAAKAAREHGRFAPASAGGDPPAKHQQYDPDPDLGTGTSNGTGTREEGTCNDQRTTAANKPRRLALSQAKAPSPSPVCQFAQLAAIAKSVLAGDPSLLAKQGEWKDEVRAVVIGMGFVSPTGETLNKALDAVDHVARRGKARAV